MREQGRRVLRWLNLANQLTFLRLACIPFFVLLVLDAQFGWAFALFVLAAVTDLLDGLSARWLDQRTSIGAFLDPAADKLLVTAAFILLTRYPSAFQDLPMVARLPIWLTVPTIFRDVGIVLVVAVMYLTQHQNRFPPSWLGKAATWSNLLTVGSFLAANALHRTHPVLHVLVWVSLALTLLSAWDYSRRTVRLLLAGDASRGARR